MGGLQLEWSEGRVVRIDLGQAICRSCNKAQGDLNLSARGGGGGGVLLAKTNELRIFAELVEISIFEKPFFCLLFSETVMESN